MYCSTNKPLAAFPSSMYAKYWDCTWKSHMNDHHPLSRRERRELRKFARQLITNRTLKGARDRLDALHLANAAAVPQPTPEEQQ